MSNGHNNAPAVPQGEPVACLVRQRTLRTRAAIAHDGKDHFSEWSDWSPATLKYGTAVTDPRRNSGPEHLFEMLPLVLATPAPAPAVPDGLQWFTVAEHGIPEVGAEVIGGLWYTDPWLKPEFATTFMWGQCRVVESKHRDFKDGKQWHTFGPSHNQITHWARINNPGQAATPAPAPAQEVTLTDEEIDTIASKYISMVGDHWCNEEAIRERHAEDFARAIIAALRAKGVV